jgi:hypothetical protein
MELGSFRTTELLDALRMHPFLFAFGIYVGVEMEQWLGYFLGYIPLEVPAVITLGAPLMLLAVYGIKQSKHQITFERVVMIGGGGLALGWPIWVTIMYLLYSPPWAPLHGNSGILSTLAFPLVIVLSYVGAFYLMYRLEMKKHHDSINGQ